MLLLLNIMLLYLLFLSDLMDIFLLLFVSLLLLLFTIILKIGPIEFLCPLNVLICFSVSFFSKKYKVSIPEFFLFRGI
jgi:hypothetical protein